MTVLACIVCACLALATFWPYERPQRPERLDRPRVLGKPQILPHVIHVRDREALRLDARYRAAKRVGGAR